MQPEAPPLAAVSLTWRDAPGAERSQAAAPMDDTTRRSLKRQGARGIVEIHTCARSLWLVAADEPAWAGALWQSHVARALPSGALPKLLVGEEAFRFALRVAVGLDSYVQGEADIGGQCLAAFDAAREEGHADGVLNQLGQSIARVIAQGREEGFIRPNRGLGQLSVETLTRLGADTARPVGVVGLGDIGKRAMASLRRAGWEGVAYNRSPRSDAQSLAALSRGGHEALIVCTAGPPRWFRPPPGVRFVVDLGVPAQCAAGGSAHVVGIDELLAGDPRALPAARLEASAGAVEAELRGLLRRVRSLQRRRGLAAMNHIRDAFLAHDLEPLLADATADLPAHQRRRVLRAAQGALRQYNHRLLGWLKEELAVEETA